MFLVVEKTLLEQLDWFLELLPLLIDHSKVKICIDIGNWLLNSFFIAVYGLINVSSFLMDSSQSHQGIWEVRINLDSFGQVQLRLFKCIWFSIEQDFPQFSKDISIVLIQIVAPLQMVDSFVLLPIPDAYPAQAEVGPRRVVIKLDRPFKAVCSLFELSNLFIALPLLQIDFKVAALSKLLFIMLLGSYI